MAGGKDCSEMVGGFSENDPSILSVSLVVSSLSH
jgi:hypothetical protein